MQRKLENTDLNAVTFEVEMSATRSTSFGSCACQRKQSTEPLPLMGLQSAVLALGPGQTSCPLSPHQTPCEASAAVPTVGPSILAASPQMGKGQTQPIPAYGQTHTSIRADPYQHTGRLTPAYGQTHTSIRADSARQESGLAPLYLWLWDQQHGLPGAYQDLWSLGPRP